MEVMIIYKSILGKPQKQVPFLSGPATKAFTPPPPRLSDHRNPFFFRLELAIFLGKYFKKSKNTVSCRGSFRCTLLLIFRHVDFNKVYLIFQRLQKKSSFFLSGTPLTPSLLVAGLPLVKAHLLQESRRTAW